MRFTRRTCATCKYSRAHIVHFLSKAMLTYYEHISVNVNGEEVFMRNASGDCSSEIKVDRLQKDVWERIESEQTRIHSGRAQRWFAGRYELEKPSKIIDHLEDGFDVEEDKEHQVLKVGKTGLSAPAAGKSAEKYVRVFEFNNIVTLVRANGHVQMLPSHCLNPEEIIVLEEATGAAIKPQEPSEDGSEGLIVMDDDE